MLTIAKALSRISGTSVDVETLKTIIIFCAVGLIAVVHGVRIGSQPRLLL